jgi:hypothetical protein
MTLSSSNFLGMRDNMNESGMQPFDFGVLGGGSAKPNADELD